MNKMDPKARECFYLGPARNHSNESKRVLVHTRKVIVTRNVTWAHAPPSLTARSKPSVEGEGNKRGRDRETSSEGSSDIAPEDEEVESVTSSSDAETSKDEQAEAMPRASSTKGKSGTKGESSTPVPSGRAASSVQSTGSVQSGVSFDPQGRVPCGEGLADHTNKYL